MRTPEQIRNRSKTVTRRLGWWSLKPGEIVNACEKCMGLKKGEKLERICQIRIVSTRAERLCDITAEEVAREGFPGRSPEQFIAMFMANQNISAQAMVNRIEFEYLDAQVGAGNRDQAGEAWL